MCSPRTAGAITSPRERGFNHPVGGAPSTLLRAGACPLRAFGAPHSRGRLCHTNTSPVPHEHSRGRLCHTSVAQLAGESPASAQFVVSSLGQLAIRWTVRRSN